MDQLHWLVESLRYGSGDAGSLLRIVGEVRAADNACTFAGGSVGGRSGGFRFHNLFAVSSLSLSRVRRE